MPEQAEYDLFIIHASEDKDSFVRPLALRLQYMGLEVWFDEFALTLGDSLSKAIDNGLRKCRFGAVILSNAFFQKIWPKKELYTLLTRENTEGTKIILPVWYGVSRSEVEAFSSFMADRIAILADKGIDAVALEIAKVVRPNLTPPKSGIELRVSVGIVQNENQFLLVRRRYPEGRLAWQFPAGLVTPRETDQEAIVRKVLGETGIVCTVVSKLGERVHPDTNHNLSYWRCRYISGTALLLDSAENQEVTWADGKQALRLITSDIYLPVKLLLLGESE